MAKTKKSTLLWSAAGLVLSLLVLLVVSGGLAGRVLVTDPGGIGEAADAVMSCIHTGDWNALELLISGNPELDPPAGEPDTTENLIWNAYRESLQWECREDFALQGSSVTQRITVTCLDISQVTDRMAAILRESEAQPKNQAQALKAAAEQVLNSGAPAMQREIALTFRRENGRWQVVSNSALLALLSGFTVS